MTRTERLALVVVVALAGFALLAAAYSREPVAGWDEDIAVWVATELPTWVEWVAVPFTILGGWAGVTALTTIAAIALLRGRAWLDLAFLLTAVVGSQITVALLKTWFDRERPDVDPAIELPHSASFPSGHATSGSACIGAVAVLAAERLPSRRARVWLWVATVLIGLGVGASRVLLGVHYVSDVLAGWCFGIAWLAACLIGRDVLRQRYAHTP